MRNNNLFLTCFLSFCVLFSSSCYKDIEDLSKIKGIKANPQIAFPILDARVGIKDIYQSYSALGLIHERPDKELSIIYRATDSLPERQFVTFPPVGVNYSFHLDDAAILLFDAVGHFNTTINNSVSLPSPNNEKIKLVKIKTGSFSYVVSSDFKHQGKLIFVYPGLTINGQALTDTVDVSYTGTSPVIVTRTVNLDGAMLDLSQSSQGYNEVPYSFQLDITKIAGNTESTSDVFSVSQELKINEYEAIEGYFGKFNLFNSTEDVAIDIFDNQIDGNVFLNNPQVRFKVSSGLGIPITAKISNMSIVKHDGTEVPVTIDLFKDTFTIPSPLNVGEYVTGEYVVDNTNSNIATVFSNAPQVVKYKVELYGNYREEERNNFIFDTSSVKLDVTAEIPVDVKVLNYALSQRGDFEFPDNGNLDIENVSLASRAENSMPVSCFLQVFFARDTAIENVQDTFMVYDSLYTNELEIAGANIDNSGNIISPGVASGLATLDRAKYEYLKNVIQCNRYVLRVRFQTSRDQSGTPQFIKIYSDQAITLKIGLTAKAKLSTQ